MKEVVEYIFLLVNLRSEKCVLPTVLVKSFTLWCSDTHANCLFHILSMFFNIIKIVSMALKYGFHDSRMKINFII